MMTVMMVAMMVFIRVSITLMMTMILDDDGCPLLFDGGDDDDVDDDADDDVDAADADADDDDYDVFNCFSYVMMIVLMITMMDGWMWALRVSTPLWPKQAENRRNKGIGKLNENSNTISKNQCTKRTHHL